MYNPHKPVVSLAGLLPLISQSKLQQAGGYQLTELINQENFANEEQAPLRVDTLRVN